MPQLSDKAIFELRPIVRNCATKKSAFVRDRDGRNVLCLVDDNNRIILHATLDYGAVVSRTKSSEGSGEQQEEDEQESRGRGRGGVQLRTVSCFETDRKRVQDMCFDPSGTMLLVLCKCSLGDEGAEGGKEEGAGSKCGEVRWAERGRLVRGVCVLAKCFCVGGFEICVFLIRDALDLNRARAGVNTTQTIIPHQHHQTLHLVQIARLARRL